MVGHDPAVPADQESAAAAHGLGRLLLPGGSRLEQDQKLVGDPSGGGHAEVLLKPPHRGHRAPAAGQSVHRSGTVAEQGKVRLHLAYRIAGWIGRTNRVVGDEGECRLTACLCDPCSKLTAELLGFGNLGRGHTLPDEGPVLFRLLVSLCGGEINPDVGLNVVLGNALAVVVHVSQVGLGYRVPLFGGLAVPEHGLAVVLGDTLAVVIHEPQVGLDGQQPTAQQPTAIGAQVLSYHLRNLHMFCSPINSAERMSFPIRTR